MTIAYIYGRTALQLASSGGHFDIVRLLLAEGADMNIADNKGMTALHLVSSDGQSEIVDCLRKWPCCRPKSAVALPLISIYESELEKN